MLQGERGEGEGSQKVSSLSFLQRSAEIPNTFKKTAEKVGKASSCNLGVTLSKEREAGESALLFQLRVFFMDGAFQRGRNKKRLLYPVCLFGLEFVWTTRPQAIHFATVKEDTKRYFGPTRYASPPVIAVKQPHLFM